MSVRHSRSADHHNRTDTAAGDAANTAEPHDAKTVCAATGQTSRSEIHAKPCPFFPERGQRSLAVTAFVASSSEGFVNPLDPPPGRETASLPVTEAPGRKKMKPELGGLSVVGLRCIAMCSIYIVRLSSCIARL
jgi:hypothetical protein